MPWMTAMTATRKATLTMMPTSVKKERSLLARIWVKAVRRASESDTAVGTSDDPDRAWGRRMIAVGWVLSRGGDVGRRLADNGLRTGGAFEVVDVKRFGDAFPLASGRLPHPEGQMGDYRK